jgi:hypothetical protein
LTEFVDRHSVAYVVEQNRDADAGLMRMELTADQIAKLRSVLYYGGLLLTDCYR